MKADGQKERLRFLAEVITREAEYLALTDSRLFSRPFDVSVVASLRHEPELAERLDAFVARFGRLQDTLANGLLPRLLEAFLEPAGSVLDNLNRAERLGWIRSASDWAQLRSLRNSMVHEYVRDAQVLVDTIQAAHEGVPDLLHAARLMALSAEQRAVG